MINFYKHIENDNWHYGAYLAFLCLKARLEADNKPAEFIKKPKPQFDKIKTYKISNDSTIKIKYKSAPPLFFSLQYKKFSNNNLQKNYTRSKTMYNTAKQDPYRYFYTHRDDRYYDYSKNKIDPYLDKQLRQLSLRASQLNSKLPRKRKIGVSEHPIGGTLIENMKGAETLLLHLKHNIGVAEGHLGIRAKTPSAPQYNHEHEELLAPRNNYSVSTNRATVFNSKKPSKNSSNVNINVQINLCPIL